MIYKVRLNNVNQSSENSFNKNNLVQVPNLITNSIFIKDLFMVDYKSKDERYLTFPSNKNYLMLLLKRSDCYDCYRDIPFWIGLDNISESLNVYTIIEKNDEHYMREFIPTNNIELPVLIDQDRKLFALLNDIENSYTPLLLFINKNGQIISATNSNYGQSSQQLN